MKINSVKIVNSYTIGVEIERKRFNLLVEDCDLKKIKRGSEIDENFYDFILSRNLNWLCRDFGLKILANRSIGKKELFNKIKLKIKKYLFKLNLECNSDKINEKINKTIDFFNEKKLLDDYQYAIFLVNKWKKKSNREIYFKLKSKGISDEEIKKAIQSRQTEERSAIQILLRRKVINSKEAEYRIISALTRKGFPLNMVKSEIDALKKKK